MTPSREDFELAADERADRYGFDLGRHPRRWTTSPVCLMRLRLRERRGHGYRHVRQDDGSACLYCDGTGFIPGSWDESPLHRPCAGHHEIPF